MSGQGGRKSGGIRSEVICSDLEVEIEKQPVVEFRVKIRLRAEQSSMAKNSLFPLEYGYFFSNFGKN